MRCHQLSVLFVLAAAIFANFARPLAPSWDDLRVKHTWEAVPPNWETLGHPPAGTTIDLHVALKPHHENALADALHEVSDPRSPKYVLYLTPPLTVYPRVPLHRCRYGAHLSKEEVAQLVAPHPDTLELINSWLGHHGVPSSSISTTHGGGWLTVTGVPVSQANELLGASYRLYRHTGTNDTTILRTIGYALPAVLHTHVQTVVPTTHFASMRNLLQSPQRRTVGATADMASRELGTVLPRSNDMVKPSDLRWLYRTVAYEPVATDRNVLGVAGYLNDYPSPADLTRFMTECRTDAIDATYTVEKVNGGLYYPNRPTPEAGQNMQYAQAMAYPTRHIFYSTGGTMSAMPDTRLPAPGDLFLAWLAFMINMPNPPQTISTSYGLDEKFTPVEYATALCNLFGHLGARGVSVIFPSGNQGVGGGDCKVNGRVQFTPLFPASCMCGILFLLGSSTPSRAQVAHIAMVLQVTM